MLLKSLRSKFRFSICSLRMYNNEMSKALITIINLLDKMAKSYTSISELFNVSEAFDLSRVIRNFTNSFRLTIDPLKKLRESVENDIQKYFRYYDKELQLLNKQFKDLSDKRTQYLTMDKNMLKKKEALFVEGKVENWKLSKDCKYSAEVLMKNKELAFSEMLISEKISLAKLHKLCGYLLHKFDEEYKRTTIKYAKQFKEHFINLGKLYSIMFEQVVFEYTNR